MPGQELCLGRSPPCATLDDPAVPLLAAGAKAGAFPHLQHAASETDLAYARETLSVSKYYLERTQSLVSALSPFYFSVSKVFPKGEEKDSKIIVCERVLHILICLDHNVPLAFQALREYLSVPDYFCINPRYAASLICLNEMNSLESQRCCRFYDACSTCVAKLFEQLRRLRLISLIIKF